MVNDKSPTGGEKVTGHQRRVTEEEWMEGEEEPLRQSIKSYLPMYLHD